MSKIDIIALAEQSEMLNSFGEWRQCTLGGLQHFSTLLEAEIRKEYEAEIEYLKSPLSYAIMQTEITALTEQNTKLMEALEKAAQVCDTQAKRHGDKAMQEDDEIECSILKSTAWQFQIAAIDIRALTPQPENREGKE